MCESLIFCSYDTWLCVKHMCVSGCLIFHLLKVRIDVAKTILNDAWIGHDKGIVGAFVLSL